MSRFLIILLCALSALAQAPPKAGLSDSQIEAQLRERLAKSVIGKDGLKATVKGGVVYWDGTTSVAQHKGAATRMAKSSGARRVVNNIKVKKSSSAAPKPTAPVTPKAGVAHPETSPTPPAAPPALNRVTVKWHKTSP